MARPRVSAIICVYNGESFVARAIESILAQDFRDAEAIVVDDGSTDRTPEALRRYSDRIRVVRQENRGLAAARNAGVDSARGEYVAFLDADDVWLAGRLARTVDALDRNPTAVLAYTNGLPVDHREQPLGDSFVQPAFAHAPSMEEMLARWWPILPSAVTMRRRTFEACAGFREDFRASGGFDDVYHWMLAREQGPFEFVTAPLIRYRQSPFVERMSRYAPGFKVFARHVRDRYGAAGDRRIRSDTDYFSRRLTNEGMRALALGDTRLARQAFRCLLQYKPAERRDLARLLRSYLPRPLAVALTSKRWRARAQQGARPAAQATPGNPVKRPI